MKVMHLINYAGNGGSEKYIYMLASNMQDVEYSLCYNIKGLLKKEFEDKKLCTYQLEMKNVFDIKAAKKLASIVKENNIEIIHTHFLRGNYIAILSKMFGMKAKIVYTCHFNQVNSKSVTMCNKIFYSKLSRIIAIANVVKESLIKSGAPKDKIKIIHHGVKTTEKMAPDDILKKTYTMDDDTIVISCASRFSPEKGNEFLLYALKELSEMTYRNFVVLLANDGITFDSCKKLARDLGLNDRITFLGFLKDDIDNLYLTSDIYVSPSQTEGFGLAMIEALKYGVPIVATNAGGTVEIVNDSTKCGITVPYGDTQAFANALKKMIEDDDFRKECKENAKKVVDDKFNMDKMMSLTKQVYQDVLKGAN